MYKLLSKWGLNTMLLNLEELRADNFDCRTYKSVGQGMSGWFSAKPIFDMIAKDANEGYLA
jgi:hypothetical protein